jgi:hypothetical protein
LCVNQTIKAHLHVNFRGRFCIKLVHFVIFFQKNALA